MSKTITIEYGGKTYTLGFNRRTVKEMQLAGFDHEKIVSQNVVMIPMLVEGAFKAYHRGIKRKEVEEIYESIGKRDEFISALLEAYAEPVASLFEEPDIDDSKKAQWGTSW